MGSAGVLIGQGFDAHRFAPAGSGRELWIAGLYWPVPDSCSEAGADAHGAGRHGIDMLQEVVAHLASNGYTPASASVAIIGNRPKIGTRRAEAEAALSAAVGCPVSVTATTTDHMGFTGRGEGIAAIANALVEKI